LYQYNNEHITKPGGPSGLSKRSQGQEARTYLRVAFVELVEIVVEVWKGYIHDWVSADSGRKW